MRLYTSIFVNIVLFYEISVEQVHNGKVELGPRRLTKELEDGIVGGSGDQLLDEASAAWGIDDNADILGYQELPESYLDGDASISLDIEQIHNLGIIRGKPFRTGGYLFTLYLFNFSFCIFILFLIRM